ncbi:hypothetical protein C8Q74DRAFT_1247275 [Fomes fomentarius]|nr:hypothetical protein C8Q74DRAFT_1247275 [Fomes fomentarius]
MFCPPSACKTQAEVPQKDHKLPPQCIKRLDYPSIHPRPALSVHGYPSSDGVVVFTHSPTSGCTSLWRAGMTGLKWKCGGRSSPRTVTASASQSTIPAVSLLPLVMNASNMLQPVVLSRSRPWPASTQTAPAQAVVQRPRWPCPRLFDHLVESLRIDPQPCSERAAPNFSSDGS